MPVQTKRDCSGDRREVSEVVVREISDVYDEKQLKDTTGINSQALSLIIRATKDPKMATRRSEKHRMRPSLKWQCKSDRPWNG
jgi:hypothetical protein